MCWGGMGGSHLRGEGGVEYANWVCAAYAGVASLSSWTHDFAVALCLVVFRVTMRDRLTGRITLTQDKP